MLPYDNHLFLMNSWDGSEHSDDVAHIKHVKDLQTWHRILGHCNVKDVSKSQSFVDGMEIVHIDDNF